MKHQQLKGILILIFLFQYISMFGQMKREDLNYLRDGISFTMTDTWKVIANDSIGNNAYYFSAERTGLKSTGIITVTWVNEIKNPLETLIYHQQTMKNANIYRNPGIEFSSVITENFAGLKVESCRYTTIVKEQKLDGTIYCFNSTKKTITIFFQTGLNDQRINQKAFSLFQQTFNSRD